MSITAHTPAGPDPPPSTPASRRSAGGRPPRLRTRVTATPAATIMTVDGELEQVSVTTFKDAVRAVLPSRGQHLIVDLAGVDFVDLSGARVVNDVIRHATEQGGLLTVLHSSAQLRAMVAMLRNSG